MDFYLESGFMVKLFYLFPHSTDTLLYTHYCEFWSKLILTNFVVGASNNYRTLKYWLISDALSMNNIRHAETEISQSYLPRGLNLRCRRMKHYRVYNQPFSLRNRAPLEILVRERFYGSYRDLTFVLVLLKLIALQTRRAITALADTPQFSQGNLYAP